MILLLQYANTQMKIDSTLIIYIKQFKFKKLCIFRSYKYNTRSKVGVSIGGTQKINKINW